MEYYVCTGGCNGTSETPATCNTEGCPRHGEPMERRERVEGEGEGMADVQGDEEERAPEPRG